jgi:hypothetical protein
LYDLISRIGADRVPAKSPVSYDDVKMGYWLAKKREKNQSLGLTDQAQSLLLLTTRYWSSPRVKTGVRA